jgi:hypothetical protein
VLQRAPSSGRAAAAPAAALHLAPCPPPLGGALAASAAGVSLTCHSPPPGAEVESALVGQTRGLSAPGVWWLLQGKNQPGRSRRWKRPRLVLQLAPCCHATCGVVPRSAARTLWPSSSTARPPWGLALAAHLPRTWPASTRAPRQALPAAVGLAGSHSSYIQVLWPPQVPMVTATCRLHTLVMQTGCWVHATAAPALPVQPGGPAHWTWATGAPLQQRVTSAPPAGPTITARTTTSSSMGPAGCPWTAAAGLRATGGRLPGLELLKRLHRRQQLTAQVPG